VSNPTQQRILCFATQGNSHLDGVRLQALLGPLASEQFDFDRDHKARSAARLFRAVRKRRPELIVMEGTGIAGGATLLVLNLLLGVRFVVCSGDAVGPYLRLRSRAAGMLGGVYERLLCRRCAGYVGWTPYLAGRALTFGAPRAMSAPGWARGEPAAGAREAVRRRLGIAPDAIVVGLVGALNWRAGIDYTYGAELVRAVARLEREDVVACVVGDGSGRARLERLAGEQLGHRVILTGRVEPQEVPDHLASFDVASLPQSVDGVGSFRYSTKLSEYLAAGLPILTGQTPMAYDLDEGFLWRLPGSAPWSAAYEDALVALLEALTPAEIERRRAALADRRGEPFDRGAQERRMRGFIGDILAQSPARSASRG
jgi:glycosyltransferase involved in cell wall biosynthesis